MCGEWFQPDVIDCGLVARPRVEIHPPHNLVYKVLTVDDVNKCRSSDGGNNYIIPVDDVNKCSYDDSR